MRIALLYPPPWKMTTSSTPPEAGEGPPREYQEGDLDGDFFQLPYGLLSLGAQAERAGHFVKVFNMSAFSWEKVEELIRDLDADLFGMSCWTANRRGVALVAREIRRRHKSAHIVVGGPHATALPLEMLAHHPEIDTIAVGESENTFLDLIARLETKSSCAAIPGTAYRLNGKPVFAGDRAAIEDLDQLASPHDYYDTHIVMTSRGCAWRCTFCGAEASWGRGYRANSIPYVVDALERVAARLPVKMVQIKDDTFTTNKKRVVALCRAIRQRGVKLRWSCDTRVDVLSDELLEEMRLAGCERLSLGVESGSQKILDAIDKKITIAEIEKSTELAKKWGIRVRYYMMVGNRGETRETFEESLRFLQRSRPHQYIFSALSVYPGTRDYDEAKANGGIDAEDYFTSDFQELKTTFDASPDDTAMLRDWFQKNKGLKELYREGVREYAEVLGRLPDHAPAHMDLAGALFAAKRWDEALVHLERALELGYPTPGLVYNYRAAIARERGDIEGMKRDLLLAAEKDPLHSCVLSNVAKVRAWLAAGGEGGAPLLEVGHLFQLFERTLQPTLPGPLPKDAAVWGARLPSPERPIGTSKEPGPRKLSVVREPTSP